MAATTSSTGQVSRLQQTTERLRHETSQLRERLRGERDAVRALRAQHAAELRAERTAARRKRVELQAQLQEVNKTKNAVSSTSVTCEQCSKNKALHEAEIRKLNAEFKKKEQQLKGQLNEKSTNTSLVVANSCEQCATTKALHEADVRKLTSDFKKKEQQLKGQLNDKSTPTVISASAYIAACEQCAKLKAMYDAEIRRINVEFKKKEHQLKCQLNELRKVASVDSTDGGVQSCHFQRLTADLAKQKEVIKDLEERLQKAVDADRLKAADLRAQHEKHVVELSRITRANRHDAHKLLEELKTKDRIIAQLRRSAGKVRTKGEDAGNEHAQMRKLREEVRKNEQPALLPPACDPKPETVTNPDKFRQNEVELNVTIKQRDQMVCGAANEELIEHPETDTDSAVSSAPSSLSPQPCSPATAVLRDHASPPPTSLSPQPSEGYTTPPPGLWPDLENYDDDERVNSELAMAKRQVRELERALLVTRATKSSSRHVTALSERVRQLEDREAELLRELGDLREQNELLEFRVLELAECPDKSSLSTSNWTVSEHRDVATATDDIPEQLNDEPVRRRIADICSKTDDIEDKKCLMQVLMLLHGLDELSRRTEIYDSEAAMQIYNERDATPPVSLMSVRGTRDRTGPDRDRLIAKVPPFTGRTAESDDDRESPLHSHESSTSPTLVSNRGTQTDVTEGTTEEENSTKSLNLTTEVRKLDKLRETIDRNGRLVVSGSGCIGGCEQKHLRQLEFYRERVDVLERKLCVYESSGELQARQLAERLSREVRLEAQVKQLTTTLNKLQSENSRLEEERCELEEAENDTRLRCQRLEADILQLERSRMAAKRRSRENRQQAAYWENMVSKYEERNYELEERECELRHRLEVMEKTAPAILLFNMWKMMQDDPKLDVTSATISRLQRAGSGRSSSSYRSKSRSPHRRATDSTCSCSGYNSNVEEKIKDLEDQRKKLVEAKYDMERKVNILESQLNELKHSATNTNTSPSSSSGPFSGPSVSSLMSGDLELINAIQELKERESDMRKRIDELEKREAAYMETLQQADEIWAEMECGYKKRITEAEQSEANMRSRLRRLEMREPINYDELDNAERELAAQTQRLSRDNLRLQTERKRLENELQCLCRMRDEKSRELESRLDRVKGELDYERRRSQALDQRLLDGEAALSEAARAHSAEIEALRERLARTANELVHLEVTNGELREEVETLEGKIAEVERGACQRAATDEQVIRGLSQELNDRDRELADMKQQDLASRAGERLGAALQSVKTCDVCSHTVSPNLVQTMEGVRTLCNLISHSPSRPPDDTQVRPSKRSCMYPTCDINKFAAAGKTKDTCLTEICKKLILKQVSASKRPAEIETRRVDKSEEEICAECAPICELNRKTTTTKISSRPSSKASSVSKLSSVDLESSGPESKSGVTISSTTTEDEGDVTQKSSLKSTKICPKDENTSSLICVEKSCTGTCSIKSKDIPAILATSPSTKSGESTCTKSSYQAPCTTSSRVPFADQASVLADKTSKTVVLCPIAAKLPSTKSGESTCTKSSCQAPYTTSSRVTFANQALVCADKTSITNVCPIAAKLPSTKSGESTCTKSSYQAPCTTSSRVPFADQALVLADKTSKTVVLCPIAAKLPSIKSGESTCTKSSCEAPCTTSSRVPFADQALVLADKTSKTVVCPIAAKLPSIKSGESTCTKSSCEAPCTTSSRVTFADQASVLADKTSKTVVLCPIAAKLPSTKSEESTCTKYSCQAPCTTSSKVSSADQTLVLADKTSDTTDVQSVKQYDLLTEVMVAGQPEYTSIQARVDMETEHEIDGVTILASVTESGNLELTTESPPGLIEHTMMYTPSGNMEITTGFVPREAGELEEGSSYFHPGEEPLPPDIKSSQKDLANQDAVTVDPAIISAGQSSHEPSADQTSLESSADQTSHEPSADQTSLESSVDQTSLESSADQTSHEPSADQTSYEPSAGDAGDTADKKSYEEISAPYEKTASTLPDTILADPGILSEIIGDEVSATDKSAGTAHDETTSLPDAVSTEPGILSNIIDEKSIGDGKPDLFSSTSYTGDSVEQKPEISYTETILEKQYKTDDGMSVGPKPVPVNEEITSNATITELPSFERQFSTSNEKIRKSSGGSGLSLVELLQQVTKSTDKITEIISRVSKSPSKSPEKSKIESLVSTEKLSSEIVEGKISKSPSKSPEKSKIISIVSTEKLSSEIVEGKISKSPSKSPEKSKIVSIVSTEKLSSEIVEGKISKSPSKSPEKSKIVSIVSTEKLSSEIVEGKISKSPSKSPEKSKIVSIVSTEKLSSEIVEEKISKSPSKSPEKSKTVSIVSTDKLSSEIVEGKISKDLSEKESEISRGEKVSIEASEKVSEVSSKKLSIESGKQSAKSSQEESNKELTVKDSIESTEKADNISAEIETISSAKELEEESITTVYSESTTKSEEKTSTEETKSDKIENVETQEEAESMDVESAYDAEELLASQAFEASCGYSETYQLQSQSPQSKSSEIKNVESQEEAESMDVESALYESTCDAEELELMDVESALNESTCDAEELESKEGEEPVPYEPIGDSLSRNKLCVCSTASQVFEVYQLKSQSPQTKLQTSKSKSPNPKSKSQSPQTKSEGTIPCTCQVGAVPVSPTVNAPMTKSEGAISCSCQVGILPVDLYNQPQGTQQLFCLCPMYQNQQQQQPQQCVPPNVFNGGPGPSQMMQPQMMQLQMMQPQIMQPQMMQPQMMPPSPQSMPYFQSYMPCPTYPCSPSSYGFGYGPPASYGAQQFPPMPQQMRYQNQQHPGVAQNQIPCPAFPQNQVPYQNVQNQFPYQNMQNQASYQNACVCDTQETMWNVEPATNQYVGNPDINDTPPPPPHNKCEKYMFGGYTKEVVQVEGEKTAEEQAAIHQNQNTCASTCIGKQLPPRNLCEKYICEAYTKEVEEDKLEAGRAGGEETAEEQAQREETVDEEAAEEEATVEESFEEQTEFEEEKTSVDSEGGNTFESTTGTLSVSLVLSVDEPMSVQSDSKSPSTTVAEQLSEKEESVASTEKSFASAAEIVKSAASEHTSEKESAVIISGPATKESTPVEIRSPKFEESERSTKSTTRTSISAGSKIPVPVSLPSSVITSPSATIGRSSSKSERVSFKSEREAASEKVSIKSEREASSGKVSFKSEREASSGKVSFKSEKESSSGIVSFKSERDDASGKISLKDARDAGITSPKSGKDATSGIISPKSGKDATSGIISPKSGKDATSGIISPQSGKDATSGIISPKSGKDATSGIISPQSGKDATSGIISPKSGKDATSGIISPQSGKDATSGKMTPQSCGSGKSSPKSYQRSISGKSSSKFSLRGSGKISPVGKVSLEARGSRGVKISYHGKDCSCKECKCNPCKDPKVPPRQQPDYNALDGENCPICRCEVCRCKNCIDPKKKNMHAKLPHMDAELPHMDDKLPHMDDKLPHMDAKLPHVDAKLSHMDDKLPHMDDKLPHMDDKLSHMDAKLPHMDDKLPHMDDKLQHMDDKLPHMDDKLPHVAGLPCDCEECVCGPCKDPKLLARKGQTAERSSPISNAHTRNLSATTLDTKYEATSSSLREIAPTPATYVKPGNVTFNLTSVEDLAAPNANATYSTSPDIATAMPLAASTPKNTTVLMEPNGYTDASSSLLSTTACSDCPDTTTNDSETPMTFDSTKDSDWHVTHNPPDIGSSTEYETTDASGGDDLINMMRDVRHEPATPEAMTTGGSSVPSDLSPTPMTITYNPPDLGSSTEYDTTEPSEGADLLNMMRGVGQQPAAATPAGTTSPSVPSDLSPTPMTITYNPPDLGSSTEYDTTEPSGGADLLNMMRGVGQQPAAATPAGATSPSVPSDLSPTLKTITFNPPDLGSSTEYDTIDTSGQGDLLNMMRGVGKQPSITPVPVPENHGLCICGPDTSASFMPVAESTHATYVTTTGAGIHTPVAGVSDGSCVCDPGTPVPTGNATYVRTTGAGIHTPVAGVSDGSCVCDPGTPVPTGNATYVRTTGAGIHTPVAGVSNGSCVCDPGTPVPTSNATYVRTTGAGIHTPVAGVSNGSCVCEPGTPVAGVSNGTCVCEPGTPVPTGNATYVRTTGAGIHTPVAGVNHGSCVCEPGTPVPTGFAPSATRMPTQKEICPFTQSVQVGGRTIDIHYPTNPTSSKSVNICPSGHPVDCNCIQCICNPCADNIGNLTKTGPTKVDAPYVRTQDAGITTPVCPIESSVKVADRIIDIKYPIATVSTKSINICPSGHPVDCQCVKCICNPCAENIGNLTKTGPTKADATYGTTMGAAIHTPVAGVNDYSCVCEPGTPVPTDIAQTATSDPTQKEICPFTQSVQVGGRTIDIHYPTSPTNSKSVNICPSGHPVDCNCIQCICNPCAENIRNLTKTGRTKADAPYVRTQDAGITTPVCPIESSVKVADRIIDIKYPIVTVSSKSVNICPSGHPVDCQCVKCICNPCSKNITSLKPKELASVTYVKKQNTSTSSSCVTNAPSTRNQRTEINAAHNLQQQRSASINKCPSGHPDFCQCVKCICDSCLKTDSAQSKYMKPLKLASVTYIKKHDVFSTTSSDDCSCSYGPSVERTRVPNATDDEPCTCGPSVESTRTPSATDDEPCTCGPSGQSTRTASATDDEPCTCGPSGQSTRTPSVTDDEPCTCGPSVQPTRVPSVTVVEPYTCGPSVRPTRIPSATDDEPCTCGPSIQPTRVPSVTVVEPCTCGPSVRPTRIPSATDDEPCTCGPSVQPTIVPNDTDDEPCTCEPLVQSTAMVPISTGSSKSVTIYSGQSVGSAKSATLTKSATLIKSSRSGLRVGSTKSAASKKSAASTRRNLHSPLCDCPVCICNPCAPRDFVPPKLPPSKLGPELFKSTIKTSEFEMTIGQKAPVRAVAMTGTEDLRNLDTETLKRKLTKLKNEMKARTNEITQIRKFMSGQQSQSCDSTTVESRSNEQTISGLQCAVAFLQEQCRQKDRMITAYTEELRLRTDNNGVVDSMLHKMSPSRQVMRTPAEKPCAPVKPVKDDGCQCMQEPPKNEDPSPLAITEVRRIAPDSLFVKWERPASQNIRGYEVEVNGEVKSRVHSAGRNATVLNGLVINGTMNLSVIAITVDGHRCSPVAKYAYQPHQPTSSSNCIEEGKCVC